MSGSGRKTSYRKAVTDKALYGDIELEEGQRVVKVIGLRGTNMFEIELENTEKSLALLPTKFRKLIWIKRGDFVIVSGSSDDYTTAEGKDGVVKYKIEHILQADQIKTLRRDGAWPDYFDSQNERYSESGDNPRNNKGRSRDYDLKYIDLEKMDIGSTDGDDNTDSEDDSDLFINRNHQGPRYDDDSDTTSSSESDEESESDDLDGKEADITRDQNSESSD